MTDLARRATMRLFNVQTHEAPAVLAGLLMFFLLFTGYAMLRPVRETMGIAGGVDNLQWLFTGTFLVALAVTPLFGWLAGKVSRRRILPWTYGVFATHLVAFAIAFQFAPENPWLARGFYIWLSVFNLLAISLAWSVLADVMVIGQAKRLFAIIAGGLSVGGLVGPLLVAVLVKPIGHAGLMLVATGFLLASIGAALTLQRWRDALPADAVEHTPAARAKPLGGSPFAGATAVLKSPFLMGIGVFVLLLASVTTFLYFEQAKLVEATFPDPARQTQVFSAIDFTVQALAIVTQFFLTGRIAQRMGVGVLLVAVPLIVAAGFLWLAFAPVFAVFVVVMVARRAGEYALVRPGREMLYTVVPVEAKYKAKNFIDTVVYRGADAASGWAKALLDMVASQPAVVAVIGAVLALVWGGVGAGLARAQRKREAQLQQAQPLQVDGTLPG